MFVVVISLVDEPFRELPITYSVMLSVSRRLCMTNCRFVIGMLSVQQLQIDIVPVREHLSVLDFFRLE